MTPPPTSGNDLTILPVARDIMPSDLPIQIMDMWEQALTGRITVIFGDMTPPTTVGHLSRVTRQQSANKPLSFPLMASSISRPGITITVTYLTLGNSIPPLRQTTHGQTH